MPNPLRLPIVQIAVFAAMLFYVHQHHRRHGGGEDRPFRPLFEQEDLQLRQPHGQRDRATVSGPLSSEHKSLLHARADIDELQSGRSPAAARLPSLNDRPRPAATGGSASAALWPPTSPYSKLLQQTAPPTSKVAPQTPRFAETAHSNRPAAATTEDTPAEVMHRIVDGDTLPGLAEAYLGDASRFPELLEANRDVLVHPDLLPLGVRIRIPFERRAGEPDS